VIDVEGLVVANRVAGVDLRVPPGVLALVEGPSGSGKSTLLAALAGLPSVARDSGRVTVAGLDPAKAPRGEVAGRVGYVLQDPRQAFLALDAAGEILERFAFAGLAERDARDRLDALARRFGLEAFLERSVATLSGGEAKRVALAAALAREPEVLLLDEPTAGLDADWRARFARDLASLAGRVTTVAVEHDAEALAPLADARYAMEGGRLGPRVARASAADDPRPRRPRPHADTRLAFEGVSWAPAPDAAPVLLDLDLAIGDGVTAITGPNGAGKSTLLALAAGHLAPTEGRVRVDGIDPAACAARALAARVGHVPQGASDAFLANTVEEDLAIAARATGRAPDAGVACALGLDPLRARHPATLSGGEAVRAAVAAAATHRPATLLLDEPTAGLDARSRAALVRLIRDWDGAVVVATHDEGLVAAADVVVEIDRGRARTRANEVIA